jgi:hypothetical protein
MATTKLEQLEPVELKLEVVVLGVSNVDRAKAFYVNLGWRLDADFSNGTDFRIIQVTPPRSPTAIISRSVGATRRVNPTVRLPRSKIPTPTAGCYRRSKRGAPAANGRRPERDGSTSQPSQSYFARRKSTTVTTRKRTPTITGGAGTRPT